MKKRILFFLSISLMVSAGFALWLNVRKVPANAQSAHPLELINQKARDARIGDLVASKELVGEIVRVARFDTYVSGFVADQIKDRVGRAESRFRNGQRSGITEAKVIRTVNGLVKKFQLPNFTKTDQYEVRKLRLELLPNFPEIITRSAENTQPIYAGMSLSAEMSPAEATMVLVFMLQQKMLSADYQMTSAERSNRWAENHNHGVAHAASSNPTENRSGQVKDAIQRAVVSSSMSDALQLSNLTLNTLGIEQ